MTDDVEPLHGSPVSRFRDVIICVTDQSVDLDSGEYQAHPPIASAIRTRKGMSDAGPVQLGREASIDRLDDELAETVMKACSRRGLRFSPFRQFGQRYSFVREIDSAEWDQPGGRSYHWDSDGVLFLALTSSRLIRDNAHSTEYAARVADHEDGEQTVIYTLFPEAKFIYRVRHDRDWLAPEEGQELADLMAGYAAAEADGIPDRVGRATWRAEYASWQRSGDTIVPVLVSGLEALLKIGRSSLTKQFVGRGSALADELGLTDVTPALLESMYDARSDWVHGSGVGLFAGPDVEPRTRPESDEQWDVFRRIGLLQELLRTAVRHCYEDREFRGVFDEDTEIDARWPL